MTDHQVTELVYSYETTSHVEKRCEAMREGEREKRRILVFTYFDCY